MHVNQGWLRYLSMGGAGLCLLMAAATAQEPAATEYGPVRAGETLWHIADELRGTRFPNATVAQVAYALRRANPKAFLNNTAVLRTGATLVVPDTAYVKQITARESKQYILAGKPLPPPASVLAYRAPPAVQAMNPQGAADSAAKAEADKRAIEAVMAPVLAAETLQNLRTPGAGIQPALELGTAAVSSGLSVSVSPGRDTSVLHYGFKEDPRGSELLAQANTLPVDQLYARLLLLESDYAGDVDYDYLLGSSALDSGNASPAVFALQRAVATAPNYAGARLELARAYFAIGDNESARREFETLRQEKPPPKVETAINEYLDAIDRRSAEYRPQRSAFAELSGGYDSNANGATDTDTFLGFALNNRNIEQASSYSGLSLGGQWSAPLRPGLRTLGDLTSFYKAYPDASFVDTAAGRLSSGLEARLGSVTLALQGSGQLLLMDDRENSRNVALDASLSLPLSELWRAGLSLRQGWQRYNDALTVQDVNQTYMGMYAAGQLENLPRAQFVLALTAGRDVEQQANSPFGRDLYGVRANLNADLWNAATLLFSVAGVKSDYAGQFFSQPRNDRQASVSLGLDWRRLPGRAWTLRGQVTATRQTSNLSLYEYDRVDAGLSLRKEFK